MNIIVTGIVSFLLSIFVSSSFNKAIIQQNFQKPEAKIEQNIQDSGVVLGETTTTNDTVTFDIDAVFNKPLTIKSGVIFNGDSIFSKSIKGVSIDLGSGSLTAGNVVYSIKPGSGIGTTGGQTPTLTNTGVLSLGGSTGAVSLDAGDGIAIDGLKITNKDKGTDQKIFKTIAVSGQSDITAGSNTDILTFASGPGVSLTTDAGGKMVTASNTGVLSLGGEVGAITLTAGPGISISGNQITNTGILTTIDLSDNAQATNILPVAHGGTGLSSIAQGGLLYANGTNIIAPLSIGNNGQYLTVSNSGLPHWSDLSIPSQYWQENNGAVAPANISDDLLVGGTSTASAQFQVFGNSGNIVTNGDITLTNGGAIQTTGNQPVTLGGTTTSSINSSSPVVIAPTQSGATTLTLKASSSNPTNLLNATSADGLTSYLSLSATGALTVNGSIISPGLLESGGAIKLTNSANSIVGTAIEGGWTLNSNSFTYRRVITVSNSDPAITMPVNYEVTVTLSGASAAQVFANSQADGDDLRIGYNSTEIARNISTFTNSSIVFTFLTQSSIAPSSYVSTYYLYYDNSLLAAGSTYLSNVQLDSADTASNWTAAHTGETVSSEVSIKQEGIGSTKVVATTGDFPTIATTSQSQLLAGISEQAGALVTGSTNYLYSIGGQNGGTSQTGVYKSTIDGSGNTTTFTQSGQGQLSSGISGGTSVTTSESIDGGTGADGTLDLSLGGAAGGCNGTGLTWTAGTNTCTVTTGANGAATGNNLPNTTYRSSSFLIPSGTNVGKILFLSGNSTQTTNIYDPTTNLFSNGPTTGTANGVGSNAILIPSGSNAGKVLVTMGNSSAFTKIFDPATNTFSAGPSLSSGAIGIGSHLFIIPSGSNAGKILILNGGVTGVTNIYDPATNTFSAGPAVGANVNYSAHSFTIPSGTNAGKILTFIGAAITTKIFDPATNTFTAGPNFPNTVVYGSHSFTIPSGSNAGKILVFAGGSGGATYIYDPATNTFAAGPTMNIGVFNGAFSFSIPSGVFAGQILTIPTPSGGSAQTRIFDPSINMFVPGPNLTVTSTSNSNAFMVPSGAKAGLIVVLAGGNTTASIIDFANAKSTFNFTSVNIPLNYILTSNNTGGMNTFFTIKSQGNIIVDGTIDLNGKGYLGSGQVLFAYGNGPGSGFSGGGGNGGVGGGTSEGGIGGSTYTADYAGSSGGGGSDTGGSAGGGGIQLLSGGDILVNTISANGINNTFTSGGAGSGGTVIAKASGSITVSGSISANGGNGTYAYGAYCWDDWDGVWVDCGVWSGNGGGGRIVLQDFDGVITGTKSVIAGTAQQDYGPGSAAQAGTISTTSLANNIYLIGGKTTVPVSTVYKAPLDGSGNIGAWSTTSQNALPQALSEHTTNTLSSTYLYTLGGNNGTSDQTTVYKSTIMTGNVGAWSTTSQGQLPQALSEHTSTIGTVSSTNYIYVVGGKNGSTAQTTVYKATIDGSGNIGTFLTTSQGQLPSGVYGHTTMLSTVNSTQYLYVLGGKNTAGTAQTAVYRAALGGSGNVGTWTAVAQNTLPQALYGASGFANTTSSIPYVYVLGGHNGSSDQTTVYKGSLLDWSNYQVTNTISSVDLTNKNSLQFKIYSSLTGSPASFRISEDGSSWQTCTFTVSVANTWETKTCDISGISAANKNAITKIQYDSSGYASPAPLTFYIDDINALTAAFSGSTPILLGASATLGAANLDINAQGTGAVRINYDPTNSLAGSGGLTVYNGAANQLFAVTSSGLASASAGIATFTYSGIINDAVYTATYSGTPTNGLIGIDSTNGRLYFRYNNTWHYTAQTAGFQIPAEEAFSYAFNTATDAATLGEFDSSKPLMNGDFLVPFVEKSLEDGAVHGMYTKLSDVTLDLIKLKELIADKALITGTAEFQGQTFFRAVVEFFDGVIFKNNMGGRATISQDTQYVDVIFTTPFSTPPIITANLTIGDVSDKTFMSEGSQIFVTNVTNTGFRLQLPALAMRDYSYNWIALAINTPTEVKSISPLQKTLEQVAGISTESATLLSPTPVATDSSALSSTQ